MRGRTFLRAGAVALALLVVPATVRAGSVSWLDEVVQEVVRDAKAGGRAALREGEDVGGRAAGRLFAREADEGLEIVARRYDDLARAGRKVEAPSEALLQRRFARLLKHDPEALRTFSGLPQAEKRLVVELGETAERLAARYPGEAETMIRKLGTEGLSAVRVFGDDVAEVLVEEGPQSLNVLRKTGRGGWAFFTREVLPHKKKLLAAGVLAAFLADPDKFVDYAGRATEYAVREFARAGVPLVEAVAGGAARGLESSVAQALEPYGLNVAVFRYLGMALAALVAFVAALVVVGLPVRWLLRPFLWPLSLLKPKGPAAEAV